MSLLKTINKGIDVVDQLVVDEDKKNELKYGLMQAVASGMLTGKGASITKITICGLVSFVVISVIIKWLLTGNVDGAMQLLPLVTPLIGMLIGAYGTGKTIQKISATKNGSQSTARSSRNMRPPSAKRDHPGGR